jgi:ubiquinone/menaquinone biosynthesis C-methylase UbiE
MTVLDVGCGKGANLRPFLEAGCECYGVEVSDEIADHTEALLSEWGYEATVYEGHNRNLPFEDNSIDILISSNVIHYEKSLEDINKGLSEYKRVMKPSGVAYITTVGPEWGPLYESAEIVEPHKYRLQVDDFRNGNIMTYFGSHKYFEGVVSDHFDTVETGREKSELMGVTRDELICVAQK